MLRRQLEPAASQEIAGCNPPGYFCFGEQPGVQAGREGDWTAMAELTAHGQKLVQEVANRHGISRDAVGVVLEALVRSGGGMAQFSHPELGGMGQWSRGGMIMIGDMFNNRLKAQVDAVCSELSDSIGQMAVFTQAASHNWWPAEFGTPSSAGAQNSMRYACFPERRRLAVELDGQLSVYDTGDHVITGVSQQQGGDQSLGFSSQHGRVRLDSLVKLSGSGPEAGQAGNDLFASLERLAGLRDKGIISEQEFAAKKADLLARL
jgi:hypothetical protein